jgi:sec-independent protein translocase protein TatA
VHLGAGELVIILLIVLLFFGPSRLPQLASSLGAAVRGFKRAAGGEDEPKPLPPQNGAASQQQNLPPQA